MSEVHKHISKFLLTIDGQDRSKELTGVLVDFEVRASIHVPSSFVFRINDPGFRWLDMSCVEHGNSIALSSLEGGNEIKIFEGEIVDLESDYSGETHLLTIRALDLLHRLKRGTKVRTFVDVTCGDIVRQIGEEYGFDVSVHESGTVLDYVVQWNETDLSFLSRLAARNGRVLYVRGSRLFFHSLEDDGVCKELSWNDGISRLSIRNTSMGLSGKVYVRGWDPVTAREIVGEAQSDYSRQPPLGRHLDGNSNLLGEYNIGDTPVSSQAEADTLAESVSMSRASRCVEVHGSVKGASALRPGGTVLLRNVGRRNSGSYILSAITHRFTHQGGFITEFHATGSSPGTLVSLLDSRKTESPMIGIQPGIVTDNNDPDALGRVKVRFPALSSEHSSFWARVVSPGAGAGSGLQCIPEIDDEVLVAFDRNDPAYPYILGGLWNGKRALPDGQAIEDGLVQKRIWKSRKGHQLAFDDSPDEEGVVLSDSHNNGVVISTNEDELRVVSGGKIDIGAGRGLLIEAEERLAVEGKSALDIESCEDLSIGSKSGDVVINKGSAGAARKGDAVEITLKSPQDGMTVTQLGVALLTTGLFMPSPAPPPVPPPATIPGVLRFTGKVSEGSLHVKIG